MAPFVSLTNSKFFSGLKKWGHSASHYYCDTSFVDLLCFFSVLCLLCLCARVFICALWPPAGQGLTSWLSFVVSNYGFVTSHWYPGSGVVLDCIDS